MTEWAIEELVIPQSMDDADAADFAASAEITARLVAEGFGTDELRTNPEEELPWWNLAAHPHRLFGVRVDGSLVAQGVYEHSLADPRFCRVSVGVLPTHRGRGIGSALANHLEQLARDEGRGRLVTNAISRDAAGDRIPAPTGFGSVPAANAEVRFLLQRGFRLEQVERASRLALPYSAPFEAPSDYRLHYWRGAIPDEWLEQMAVLYSRMTTDAPSAGIEEPEDVYTVERVQEVNAAYAKSPLIPLLVAVEHVLTGTLAGYSTLSAPAETSRTVRQYATLVLREHRGHRLGMLLKLANIDHLQRIHPGHPSIISFNAEENRFMLDVNEELGFAPMGYEGAWRKDLV